MWQGILGHDDVAEHFRATLRRGRLASTYLFVGPRGIGKRRFALELAKTLLCPAADDAKLVPCNRCESCRLFDAGSHPDLDLVQLPKDKSTLPLELFIGDKEHRNQEGLCHRVAMRPFLGGRKVAIVDDADHFSQESANCLLKTLEEPPPRSLLILLGTSPSRQLPTIRSRSQVVRFRPLSTEVVAQILLDNGTAADLDHALRLATHGEGSVARAGELADPALWQFRAQLLHDLSVAITAATPTTNSVRLAKSIQSFVEEAGKDGPPRRDRLRLLASFAEEYYRGLLRARIGGSVDGDELLRTAVARTPEEVPPNRAIDALEYCLAVSEQVDRNANLGLVIQHWCERLARRMVAS